MVSRRFICAPRLDMELQRSCKEAIASCLDQKTFAVSHLYNDDNRFYSIEPGDIFFINQYESHHLTYIDEKVHERIVLSIFPDFLKQLSSGQTNLDNCFSSRDALRPPGFRQIAKSFHAMDIRCDHS